MTPAARLAALRAGVYATYSLDQIPTWVTEKTFLNGKNYSFKGHEFQLKVLQDTSQETNCQKCSQIGMTEAQGRWSLGVCKVFPGFSLIYTMPFSGDAQNLCKTRIDPIINDSPELKGAVSKDLNNSEVKMIGSSLIYFRGTQGNTQAISIPADCIISDEIDRSSSDILDQYTSRLTHSAWKLRRNFSTPTVEGYGIALKMQTSRRFRNICKCEFCAHYFIPDYYEHVKIPGYDGDLEVIDKRMLSRVAFRQAALHCPHCGKVPSLLPQHREWVRENTQENHEAAGYYVSPFDAPLLITVGDLIKASTEYRRISEFKNQNLGITAQEAAEVLTREDLVRAKVAGNLADSGLYALGADMGLICHICIGRIDPSTDTLVVVHRERVLLGNFERRIAELQREYRCVIKVFDSLPYVDLIMRMQKRDPNLYASVFVKTKRVEAFKVVEQSETPKEGKLDVRQVQVNRNKALDELVGHIKQNGLALQADENEEEDFISHCLDMKRVQKIDDDGDLSFSWEKSATADDHYFFSLLYLFVAARMRGLGKGTVLLPQLVSSFRRKAEA